MKGVGVLRGPLLSDALGVMASYITAVVVCYPWMKMGSKVEIFYAQHVTVEQMQPYCAYLSPGMMRIEVKREEVVLTVMSVIMISAAVVVGRMHQPVATTACTV